MVRKLLIGVVLAVALSAAAGNAYAGLPEGGSIAFGIDGAQGLFCEVEKADVCGDGADGGRLHEARWSEGGHVWSARRYGRVRITFQINEEVSLNSENSSLQSPFPGCGNPLQISSDAALPSLFPSPKFE